MLPFTKNDNVPTTGRSGPPKTELLINPATAAYDPLNALLRELETLPDRRALLAKIHVYASAAPKRGRTRTQAFVARVVRPYISGVPRPLFVSDYPTHWPRFKAIWDRLPAEKIKDAAA